MSEGVALPRSSGWMVSPGWDLAFIIASPLAIVPVVAWLVSTTLTPEQLAIPVFAFGTLGHHLPGYMRAYGDRELFARFRLRFVVVPPVLFGVVLLLVEPAFFGLAFPPPRTLQLLLVVWGAWHGLMQIYGFMRIYDAKQGVGHGISQRLDMGMCFAIFVSGFLYSDPRMYALMDLAWTAGLPRFGREGLEMVRIALGAGVGVLAIAYVANLVRERRAGRRMGGVKLLLAVTTGGIYTFSGLVTTNLLVGAAMFEVFHAVQYLAIVWYFNRRLEDRVGDGFGPLRMLFRNRWSSLLLYLGAVAAFGSIFLAMGTPGYGPIVASEDQNDPLFLVFSAFFVASSLLHYYYDGFIWKLHDRDTGRNLGVTGPGLSEMSVPTMLHLAKWGALALLAAGLVALEISQPMTADAQQARLLSLEALTPNVDKVEASRLRRLLAAGDTAGALASAERRVSLDPRSHYAFADLGRVHVARQDWGAAEAAYRRAIELRRVESVYYTDLARVLAQMGESRLGDAAEAYREAIRHDPDEPALGLELAAIQQKRGDPEAAAEWLAQSLERAPADLDLRDRLIATLLEAGNKRRAIQVAEAGVALAPESARAHLTHGLVLMEVGHPAAAAKALVLARDLDPELPGIDYQVGRARVFAGRYHNAESDLRQARARGNEPANLYALLAHVYAQTDRAALAELSKKMFVEEAPDLATGYRTLGARLLELGDPAGAADAYEKSLELHPAHPPTMRHLQKLRAQGH